MAGAGVIDPQVRARVRAALPHTNVEAVLHDNGKALVLSGVVGGRRAVVKVLVDLDPFWEGKFAAELATYRAFEAAPPPVPVPRLLGAKPGAGVLATTWLPGLPVHTDRFPALLDTTKVGLLVEVASRLQSWQVPAGLFSPVFRLSRPLYPLSTPRAARPVRRHRADAIDRSGWIVADGSRRPVAG